MRNLLISIAAIALFPGLGHAAQNNNTIIPVFIAQPATGITVYAVGGTTTTTATFAVYADSCEFVTAGGLYPGTTNYEFSVYPTLKTLAAAINATPATTPGAEGGLVAVLPNGVYDGNLSTELTATGATACKGAANAATFNISNVLGIEYTLLAADINWRDQYHCSGLSANATFATGTTFIHIYDGADNTATELLRYKVGTSAAETPVLCLPSNGDFGGTRGTAMTFSVISSSWITSGYMSIIGHKE